MDLTLADLERDALEHSHRQPPPNVEDLSREIRRLAAERRAVLLAHNYQLPEVQDVADYVGDSLGLSRRAAATEAEVIVFCGVHFMAETAAILCPDKRVLLPDLEAGCSLAASIDADRLQAWKKKHPDALVVSYVNTSAEVKALSDYCCTSGNAERVIRAIPPEREVLFLPDLFLGTYLERVTGRRLLVWPGECHVHAGILPEDIERARREHGDADLLVHPECGCASQCLYFAGTGDLDARRTLILSTEGMVEHVRRSPKQAFVVATELGILHRLRREAPDRDFFPATERAICRYMKRITLDKVLRSLREDVHPVTVPPQVAERARAAIQRMLEL